MIEIGTINNILTCLTNNITINKAREQKLISDYEYRAILALYKINNIPTNTKLPKNKQKVKQLLENELANRELTLHTLQQKLNKI